MANERVKCFMIKKAELSDYVSDIDVYQTNEIYEVNIVIEQILLFQIVENPTFKLVTEAGVIFDENNQPDAYSIKTTSKPEVIIKLLKFKEG